MTTPEKPKINPHSRIKRETTKKTKLFQKTDENLEFNP